MYIFLESFILFLSQFSLNPLWGIFPSSVGMMEKVSYESLVCLIYFIVGLDLATRTQSPFGWGPLNNHLRQPFVFIFSS